MRSAKLQGSVAWNNGDPFNGFFSAGLVIASEGSAPVLAFPSLGLTQLFPRFTTVPIIAGAYSQDAKLVYNSDIVPPGSQYVGYFYDVGGTRIAQMAALFTISTAEYTPTVPTLPIPVVDGGGDPEVPEPENPGFSEGFSEGFG